MNLLLIVSSLLIGSSLGAIFSKLLATRLPNIFFDMSVPGVTQELISFKLLDLYEFILTTLATLGVFLVNYYLLRTSKSSKLQNTFLLVFLTATAALIFIQTQFIDYSGKVVLAIFLLSQTGIFLLSKLKSLPDFKKPDLLVVANGLLLGFPLLLLTNKLMESPALSLLMMLLPVFFYNLYANKFPKTIQNKLHLLFVFSAFTPASTPLLLLLTILILITILKFQNLKISSKLYPIIFIALLTYNPLYYLGNFDSVEEGFWLGWLQNMLSGKVLYKDIAAYHPPIIPWLIFLVNSALGASIKNTRLLFHLLEIAGFGIIFLLINKLITKKIYKALTMLIVFSLPLEYVKNNVTIRLAVGLAAIYTARYSVFSGILSALAFFVSLEVGIAVIISLTISNCLISFKRLRRYLSGVFIGFSPIVLYLALKGALLPFIEQASFYAKAFSEGYFNTPLDRAIRTSLLHWHLIWQNFATPAWMVEFARMIILAALMVVFLKLLDGKLTLRSFKKLDGKEIFK